MFAGFISIATMAYSMRASVKCTYVQKDKPRITERKRGQPKPEPGGG